MLGWQKHRGSKTRPASPSLIEALEARQMLAVSLSHGVLMVSGTLRNDSIVVSLTRNHGWQYVVDINGQRRNIPARQVKAVRVLGRAGNDRIAVGRKGAQIKAKVSVNAGPGDDVVLMPKQAVRQVQTAAEQAPASGEQPPINPPAPPQPPAPPLPPQDPPVQDPPPVDPEEPLNVRPFTVYDDIRFKGTPDLSGYGLQPITVMYNELYNLLPSGQYDFLHPDEGKTRQFARDAAAKGYIVALDIEQWSLDTRVVPQDQVDEGLRQINQIIDWIRDEEPDLKLGLWSMIPGDTMNLATNDTPQNRAFMDAVNAMMAPIAAKVDILYPVFYPWTTDVDAWIAGARIGMEYARQYNKPVIPFVSPFYSLFAGSDYDGKFIPAGYWRLQLDTMRQLADGVVIWTNHYLAWNEKDEWWSVLRDFTNEVPRLPAAPTDLTAAPGPTSITIFWKDNADNEGGYIVERSEDGINFQPYSTAPANSTSWTDMDITRRYEYRVRAANSFGTSDVSNSDGAVPFRLATSKTQAEGYDAASPSVSADWAVWNLGQGRWIRFDDMVFDRPISQFVAGIGSPYVGNGQALEIHLDAPNGPIIGRLVLQVSPYYWRTINQSTNVSSVVGVHDVYLVGTGTWGTASLDWFVFQ